jgi:Uma2 family endonuclease
MTTAPEPMTADDLTRLPRGRARHELVRGELRTMSLFEIPEALAVSNLAHSLHNFACDRHLGSVLPSVGYRLETDPDTVRGPAVSFITRERVEAIGRIPGYWLEAPALAVEVYAPSDIYSHVAERVADYLEHGTPLVWVLDARRHIVTAHRPGQRVQVYAGDAVLDAEGVIPGWKLPLGELFTLPWDQDRGGV